MKAPSRRARRLRAAGVVLAASAALAGGLTACSSDESSSTTSSSGPTVELTSNPASGEAIKIGFITPEGGAVSLPQLREAGEAAAKYLNENGGGIKGHKVDLVVCKELEEPASATSCANQMVEQKASVVVSPFTSTGAVILPILSGANIPYVAISGVSQAEMASPMAFMLTGGSVGAMSAMATQAAKDGVKKFSVIIGDTGDAAASTKALGEPMFKAAGVDLSVITVPTSIADPTPNITAAINENKPDAVTILGDSRQCTTALKALQTAAPGMKQYLISTCIDKSVVDAVGVDAIAGGTTFTTVNLDDQTDESVKVYRSVMAQYAPDVDPNGIAYMGYQAVMALNGLGAQLPTGAVTAQDMTNALRTSKNVPVPAAPGLTYTCDGKAMPMLPSLCGMGVLVSKVSSDGKLTDTVVLNQH
ncbi:ABC transporter substrate-binding protein [Gordonia neofelifaecis]|uniref:ABC transporter substrate-binding protein n=1 Tax=Gordonia neofelifaecis TaxID=945692 RepID=UPI00058E31CB|nr:ABC transporter substrate-binding protein [Gordonia neofelifaecis]